MPGLNYIDPDSNELHNTFNGQEDSEESQLEELRPEDFPSYFLERDERLFPATSSLTPYPLPVDTPEQERVTLLHKIIKQFIGTCYVGPVPDVLAPETGRQKMVLDLCTGNGKWVMDMAREFPHVYFRGIDIVPIATRYPPSNVKFEMQNVNNTNYRWTNETFDLIHARSVSMAVRDYPTILQEVSRLLRPGGLFVSCEWGRYVAFDPSFQQVPSIDAPASVKFFDAITNALALRGIQPIAHQIPTFLANSGCFTDITVEQKYIPVGVWPSDLPSQNIGADCLKVHERYADSFKPLLLETCSSAAVVERVITDYIQELHTVSGLVDVLHTVHARRL